MKTYILPVLLLLASPAFADCENSKNSFEIQKCMSENVRSLKAELNKAYKKIYEQTEAKPELEASQKAWLNYRELQCGNFVAVDSGHSPAAAAFDLECQSILIQQRIDYLKTLSN